MNCLSRRSLGKYGEQIMKYTNKLLISLLLVVMLGSCVKSNVKEDDIFYGYDQES